MPQDDTGHSRLLGRLALGLLAVAVLAPLAIAAKDHRCLALGVGFVTSVLAALFGALAWRQTTGKTALILGSCLTVLALGAGAMYFYAPQPEPSDDLARGMRPILESAQDP